MDIFYDIDNNNEKKIIVANGILFYLWQYDAIYKKIIIKGYEVYYKMLYIRRNETDVMAMVNPASFFWKYVLCMM